MTVTIEPSDDQVIIDGVPCRLWYGQSDIGTPVVMAVYRVASAKGADTPDLDAVLEPRDPPREILCAVAAIAQQKASRPDTVRRP